MPLRQAAQFSLFERDAPIRPLVIRNDVRAGDAAEAFVIAKLLKWGYDAHDARRDLPYDVVVDVGCGRICRIQVKGRGHSARARWSFRSIRGNWRSATGTYGYADTDFDVSAYVALSLEKVLFKVGVHPSHTVATPEFLRDDAELGSWRKALAEFQSNSSSRTVPA